ncbi:7184_t:CDS:2 [Gigaspora rosea]|nr:7184_t:CDS:2 [Gigaspora rosea]
MRNDLNLVLQQDLTHATSQIIYFGSRESKQKNTILNHNKISKFTKISEQINDINDREQIEDEIMEFRKKKNCLKEKKIVILKN